MVGSVGMTEEVDGISNVEVIESVVGGNSLSGMAGSEFLEGANERCGI